MRSSRLLRELAEGKGPGFFEPCMLPRVNLISNRRRIVFGANTAQTPDQVRVVRTAVDLWLRRHPEDKIIQRAGRQLEISEDQLRKVGKWH